MAFEVLLHPDAQKALSKYGSKQRQRIKAALRSLADDPFTARSGADIRKLKGTKGRQDLYRLRVGRYRAVYAVEGHEVLVTKIFERGEGYDI